MRKRLFLWELCGFFFVAAVGTLLHFVYDWTGGSALAAAFSAVNESTWEHMKLLFMPLFLYSAAQVCATGRSYLNFCAVRAVSALAGIGVIPVLFYTYTGVLGFSVTWVNLAIFYLAVGITFLVDYRMLTRGRLSAFWQQLAGLAILWGLVFLFVWCSFQPPMLGLWQDSVTGQYGR